MLAEQVKALTSLFQELVSQSYFPSANIAVGIKSPSVEFPSVEERRKPRLETTDSQYDEFAFSVGMRDENTPNNLDTIYDCASLTKVIVTTTLILQLIDAGRLTLDTPVSKFLPRFRHKDVTVQDLLTHTSGLPSILEVEHDQFAAPLDARRQRIIDRVYEADLENLPGAVVSYSDYGFLTLGFLIEAIYGKKINDLAHEKIFAPIGMHDTYYACELTPSLASRCAPTEFSPDLGRIIRGEAHDENTFIFGKCVGHAGVFSTVTDLAKFAQMILNDGEFGGHRILSSEIVSQLFNPLTPAGEIKRSLGYLTFDHESPFSDTLNSEQAILHTGFTGTSILIDKGKGIYIIMLSNRVHPTRDNQLLVDNRKQIHHKILEIIADETTAPACHP